jgi:hypothetical protein
MSTDTLTLSVAQRLMLRKLVDKAYKRRAFVTPVAYIGNYHLMLRHSGPKWPADGLVYETLDVVQIGYAPYMQGECELTDVPKRGGVLLLRALEELCQKKGVALRIECIGDDKLREYYIKEHGFKQEGWGVGRNYSTSVLKPLDVVGEEYKSN